MTGRAKRFRQRALAENGGRLGHGARYSEELRTEAALYYREQVAAGSTKASIASELGVAQMTVERWARETRGRVQPVELLAEETRESSEAGLRVIAPSGHRVEGLTVSSAATLLRALA